MCCQYEWDHSAVLEREILLISWQDGIVRIKLAKLLQKHPNVIYEESEAKNGGVEMVGFVLFIKEEPVFLFLCS